MKVRLALILVMLAAIGMPASAHRLDEYLQATTITVDTNRVHAQVRLTPGVAVFRRVFANIDTNGDGMVSPAEQRDYAERVLRDLSMTIDGKPLLLELASWTYPPVEDMKEGRGEIQIEFNAFQLPPRERQPQTGIRESSPGPDFCLSRQLPGTDRPEYSGIRAAAKLPSVAL